MMDRVEKSYNSFFHRRIISPRMICYTGFKCNLRCRFCYYLDSLECGRAQNRSIDAIKRQLRIGRFFKKDQIEFTGGEPTIIPEFTSLILYARSLGYKKIGLITNGFRMSDKDYCAELKNAGVNDLLFSFHSYDPEMHDWLTQVKGSHDRLVRAVRNAIDLNMPFRFNSVVTSANCDTLFDHMKFLASFNPLSVNLIVFNPSEETSDCRTHETIRFTSYEHIGRRICDVLRDWREKIPVINVRFIPFCFMKGYEEHVRGYWQAIYEEREWDPFLHMGFRKGFAKAIAASFIGFLMWPWTLARYGKKNFYTLVCEWMQSFRIFLLFRKKKECRKCSLMLICNGFNRDFIKKYGETKVYPYKDIAFIRNPVFFALRRYAWKFPCLTMK